MVSQSSSQKHFEGYTVNDFRLPGLTHIGYVHLQVSNLKRSLHFYETLVGLKRAIDLGDTVVLSASGKAPYHIMLTELPARVRNPQDRPGCIMLRFGFLAGASWRKSSGGSMPTIPHFKAFPIIW